MRDRKTPGLFSKPIGKVWEFSRSYAVVLTLTSISKKGRSPDNSAMGGFFGRFKNEFFHHRDRSGVTMPEFCRMLDAYPRYYNEERPKEKLGWLSPMQYRRSFGLTA